MGWNNGKWKLNLKAGKDKWIVMLAMGLILLILAFPMGKTGGEKEKNVRPAGGGNAGQAADENFDGKGTEAGRGDGTGVSGESAEDAPVSGNAALTYEQQLEQRLEQVLSHVDGVGKAEVMIVLRSSEEKVWRVDRNTSYSVTQETDQNGGSRRVESQEVAEDTILQGQTGQQEPVLEKELKPEISGVIVSAQGGGSPQVQAEISAAVEALFGIPSHKIKVLKRVE